jgi:hypothetical protein
MTVCAIGPGKSDIIDKIVGGLEELWKDLIKKIYLYIFFLQKIYKYIYIYDKKIKNMKKNNLCNLFFFKIHKKKTQKYFFSGI